MYSCYIKVFEQWLLSNFIKEITTEVLERFVLEYQHGTKKEPANRSDNTILQVLSAIRYKLVTVEKYPKNIVPKGKKHVQLVNEHQYIEKAEMKKIQVLAAKRLDIDLCVRIQVDLAGRI